CPRSTRLRAKWSRRYHSSRWARIKASTSTRDTVPYSPPTVAQKSRPVHYPLHDFGTVMRQDRGMASADVDIITGEAVAIEVRPASFSSRLIGGVIDVVALTTVLMFLMIAVGAIFEGVNID